MFQEESEDPVALLLACHERIRRYSEGVRQLSLLGGAPDPRAAPTAEACLRYFREALGLHAADEDEELAPRLRALGPTDAVARALDAMTAEHAAVEAGVPGLCAALAPIAAGGPGDPAALAASLAWIDGVLLPHIAAEEVGVFPAAAALPAAERAAITAAIRARRRG